MDRSSNTIRTTRPGRAIDRVPAGQLRSAEFPAVTNGLWWVLQDVIKPHGDVGAPVAFSGQLIDEARRVLPIVQSACEPPDERDVRLWLAPLVTAVSNPPDGESIGPYVQALMLALANVPRASVRPATQAEALRRFKFWPAVSEVWGLLSGDSARLVAVRVALEKVAAATPAIDQAA